MQICYIKPKPSKYAKQVDNGVSFAIKDARRFMMVASTLLGVALTEINTYAGTQEILRKVDSTGLEVFGICRGIGFWGAVILMVIDIIKSIKKEDVTGIIKICVRYSIFYASIYFAPEIVMLVVDMFK